jgi:hypothetical protein
MSKIRTLLKTLLPLGILVAGAVGPLASAQSVPQGYQSASPLQPGIIVQLTTKKGNTVEPLTFANQAQMLGVVVSPTQATVSISNNAAQAQTFVAAAGEYPVLVSTQNGPVKIGSYITISAITGVGMVANSSNQVVLGKAMRAFDGKSNVVSTTQLTNSLGAHQAVSIGDIQVNIEVGHNPLYSSKNTSGVPSVLSSAAKVVSDRPVSALRIYASLIILLITLIIAGLVLYIGVRASITAVGRNPLAKKTIIRSMISIIITSVIVFIIGLIAVYLLLKL